MIPMTRLFCAFLILQVSLVAQAALCANTNYAIYASGGALVATIDMSASNAAGDFAVTGNMCPDWGAVGTTGTISVEGTATAYGMNNGTGNTVTFDNLGGWTIRDSDGDVLCSGTWTVAPL